MNSVYAFSYCSTTLVLHIVNMADEFYEEIAATLYYKNTKANF